MTMTEAEQMIGKVVNSHCGIWGVLEYLTSGGWAGVRGPTGRLDEIQVSRIYPDPT